MENLEIKEITIDNVISSVKLVWETMKEFNQIKDCMKNNEFAKKFFINEVVEDYLDDKLFLIGAFIDNQVVGVIGSMDNYINFFFVKKEYQNKKIGKKLMYTMLENLKQKYSDAIEVDSSSYAINIYKNFGFVDVEEAKIDKEEHLMVYKLRRDYHGI